MPSVASTPSYRTGRSATIDRLVRRLEAVRRSLRDAETRVPLERFGSSRESARNLVHYLALRKFDLRSVQTDLEELGLSSLGRAEGHVLHNLESVLAGLYALQSRAAPKRRGPPPIHPREARRRIARNADALFGPAPSGRDTRIMVTAPVEVARDSRLVRELLRSGTDCLRINCAHDTCTDWSAMIRRLRQVSGTLGRECRVEMDLGGPRLRTGSLASGPAVLKIRPQRDSLGRSQRPAELLLTVSMDPARDGALLPPTVEVPERWLRGRRRGERLRFRDARGAQRELVLRARTGAGWVATCGKTSYLTNGTLLVGWSPSGRLERAVVSGIAPVAGRIRLNVSDRLRLSRFAEPGHDRAPRPGGRTTPAVIGISAPGVVARLRQGERVWFDGGRFGASVRSVTPSGALLLVEHAPSGGGWLRADQGINFPDTDLGLPPLTGGDLDDLAFAVQYADLVGYSFVQSADDVLRLRRELRRLGRPRMGIVLKIETRRAFEQLPEILLAALRSGPAAVMVARGDLAVEVGFERLAEVQEETLWLAEAAHLPAIWATQVLEGLAKSGIPSRAEVTDAAMGERAECVMLNKGPYLVPAVRALDSIVRRMQAHQEKKSARLRHLAVAERFLRSRA